MNRLPVTEINHLLQQHHYLGPTRRGWALSDAAGVLVFSSPSSRRLPKDWLELTRWCLLGRVPNAGSAQWRLVRQWLLQHTPATTIVSYSDPSQGHTGALYRACNWLWAPTWHVLRPPPSGNGRWSTAQEHVKHRWIFPLRPDSRRQSILRLNDESLIRRLPWAEFKEKTGGDYKQWKAQAPRAVEPGAVEPWQDSAGVQSCHLCHTLAVHTTLTAIFSAATSTPAVSPAQRGRS